MPHKESSWKFAEELVTESDAIGLARQHSLEAGVEAVSPGVGAQLALTTALIGAKNIIEIGTGLGVSGLWLMAGAPSATLTSIDSEVDHQQTARETYVLAGIPANRVRLIAGRAREVLPRMNENSYDVVLIDADPEGVIEYVEHGLRLARTGGIVLVAHALWNGRVANPAAREQITADYRTLLTEVSTSPAVISSLATAGDGLLQLVKR
ncbi:MULTISPECIES: O-methyltransferase [unclassified Frondihabitans]|uniref:O-methyltransferase n=1 Tax=unclassified Frondihabitans TaxID=2626248 RepID=UPI0006F62809|nr:MULTISPECIES: class I SAM-dependent methyltransferase [unclassified Frondihabitans]KQQ26641.1 methyltransferase [Frondihabitans sp. Leaf304]MBF4576582.1 class I SAM-dependent methyltransferase [Frondihabitans sp. VKM Ac-2883]RPE76338.1 putative O-methyltransferase YrrM [Frondihabitans sp. PhB153]RPF05386.1 putative O-methyltransferase YrrM [Frondihabitans sp. PhB161]